MGNKKYKTPFRTAEFVHVKRNGMVCSRHILKIIACHCSSKWQLAHLNCEGVRCVIVL